MQLEIDLPIAACLLPTYYSDLKLVIGFIHAARND